MSRNRLPPELLLEIVLCVRRGHNTPNICFSSRILRTFMEPRVALWRRVWISMLRKLSDAYQKALLTPIWNYVNLDENCQMFFGTLVGVFRQLEVQEYTGPRKAICSLVNVENQAVNGSITFTQESPADSMAFEGRIKGINANHCDLFVHEFDDLSEGLSSVGPVFNPPQTLTFQPAGVLKPGIPVILGIANVSDSSSALSLFGPRNIIGRALVLRKGIVSGQGECTSSESKKIKETESTAEFVAIGIIGRATSK